MIVVHFFLISDCSRTGPSRGFGYSVIFSLYPGTKYFKSQVYRQYSVLEYKFKVLANNAFSPWKLALLVSNFPPGRACSK